MRIGRGGGRSYENESAIFATARDVESFYHYYWFGMIFVGHCCMIIVYNRDKRIEKGFLIKAPHILRGIEKD